MLPLLGSSTGLVFDAFLPAVERAALQAKALAEPGAPSAAELAALQAQIRRARPAPRARPADVGGRCAVGAALGGGGELVGVITVVGTASSFPADPEGGAGRAVRTVAAEIQFADGRRGARWRGRRKCGNSEQTAQPIRAESGRCVGQLHVAVIRICCSEDIILS